MSSVLKKGNLKPAEARLLISQGKITDATCGMCNDFLQANVVILPKYCAEDFKMFCELNNCPAPLLEILDAGNPFSKILANENADIRKCIPKYRIYSKEYETNDGFIEVNDISKYWTSNMVTFFLGCSFTFESALIANGIKMKHIQQNKNVAMYDTNIMTNGYGRFASSPMVVSMRPIKKHVIAKTYAITEPYKCAHGSPIHFGNWNILGIADIKHPEYGHAIDIASDEYPVFWACGITTQIVVKQAIEVGSVHQVITHSPGHMFISDLKIKDVVQAKQLSLKNSKL